MYMDHVCITRMGHKALSIPAIRVFKLKEGEVQIKNCSIYSSYYIGLRIVRSKDIQFNNNIIYKTVQSAISV